MYQRKSIIKLFVSLPALLFAPWGVSQPFNLDQILEKARSQSGERDLIEARHAQMMAQINTFRSAALPQISTEVSANRIGVPLNAGAFGTGGAQSSGAAGVSGGSSDKTHAYGNDYRWNLNLAAPLITFGKLGSLMDTVGHQKELAEVSQQDQIQKYFLRVIETYNQSLLALNIHEAAKRAEKLAESVYNFTDLEYKNGGRSKVDYLRSKSAFNLAQAEKNRSSVAATSNLEMLKILIGVPKDQSLELKLGTKGQSNLLNQTEISPKKPSHQTIKEMEVAASESLLEYRSSHWPTLYLIGGISSNLQKLDIGGIKTNENVPPENIFKQERMQYSIGLALKWTLFDGLKSTSESREQEASAAIKKIELDQMRRKDQVELASSKETISVAKQIFEATERAVEAAEIAFKQVEADYKAGAAALKDVLEVQSELANAERQLFEAFANRILAIARYRIASGVDLYGANQ